MKEELIVSVNGSTTHNNTSVWEFCDSTARVLVLEITQLAKDTISQINDTPSFKQHPQRAHKSAYEQPYQHWQSLAEFTRYTFCLPPPPHAMKFFQSNAFQNFWSEVYLMYAESVGNGKACYRQEIISWWGLSLSFLSNTLIIK